MYSLLSFLSLVPPFFRSFQVCNISFLLLVLSCILTMDHIVWSEMLIQKTCTQFYPNLLQENHRSILHFLMEYNQIDIVRKLLSNHGEYTMKQVMSHGLDTSHNKNYIWQQELEFIPRFDIPTFVDLLAFLIWSIIFLFLYDQIIFYWKEYEFFFCKQH